MSLAAILVASAPTDRLRSTRPAPVHVLCGQPVAVYVLDALAMAAPERVVVVAGDDIDPIAKKLTERAADPRVSFAEQRVTFGSAGAVEAAMVSLDDPLDEGDVIVVPADAPLIRAATIDALVRHHQRTGAAGTVLTVDRHGDEHDRLVRGREDRVLQVGPGRRLHDDPRATLTDEWITGVYCFRRSLLAPALRRVRPDPISGDERLADVVAVLTSTGHAVEALGADDPHEFLRVTDRLRMARAERTIRQRINLRWLEHGVSMVDPDRTYLDTTVKLARDVTLFPGTLLQGDTVVGPGAEIGPDTRLIDCAVGAGAVVEKTMARDAEIGVQAQVGPFAVLEPGTQIPAATRTGPFYHARGVEEPGD